MALVLVRHTRPSIAGGVCYGQLDIPLSESAANDIRSCLQQIPLASRVITSPAQRCRVLAQAIAARHGISAEPDPRLRELNFGAWEGLRWDAVERNALDAWAADTWGYAPGGGEPLRDLWARIDDFRQEFLATGHSFVVIVSHNGPLQVIQAQCAGLPHRDMFDLSLDFGELRVISSTTPTFLK